MSLGAMISENIVNKIERSEKMYPEIEKYDGENIMGCKEISMKETKMPDVEMIKSSSIQQLVEENKSKITEVQEALLTEEKEIEENKEECDKVSENVEKKGLTEEEKIKIKELTGWSDEIINTISSIEEAEIYIKAALKEVEINGKKCLIREDIDWDQKDEMGRTNKERAEQGLSPITKDGKTVELHHIGQHADSPLAELTAEQHRGKGNDTILHNKTKESEIDRQIFSGERSRHWEKRAELGGDM